MVISEIDFPHKISALLPSFNLAPRRISTFMCRATTIVCVGTSCIGLNHLPTESSSCFRQTSISSATCKGGCLVSTTRSRSDHCLASLAWSLTRWASSSQSLTFGIRWAHQSTSRQTSSCIQLNGLSASLCRSRSCWCTSESSSTRQITSATSWYTTGTSLDFRNTSSSSSCIIILG